MSVETVAEVYTKEKYTVLVNTKGIFVYEVCVYCRYTRYFSLVNSVYYSSLEEIPHIVRSFYKDPHTEITCELYSAPMSWLLDNDYVKYVKPDKKVKTIKSEENGITQITVNKRTNSTATNKTSSTRTKKS